MEKNSSDQQPLDRTTIQTIDAMGDTQLATAFFNSLTDEQRQGYAAEIARLTEPELRREPSAEIDVDNQGDSGLKEFVKAVKYANTLKNLGIDRPGHARLTPEQSHMWGVMAFRSFDYLLGTSSQENGDGKKS